MSYINPEEIDKIVDNAEFSGSIHIMKNGEALYHRSMGWADYEAQYSFPDNTTIDSYLNDNSKLKAAAKRFKDAVNATSLVSR